MSTILSAILDDNISWEQISIQETVTQWR